MTKQTTLTLISLFSLTTLVFSGCTKTQNSSYTESGMESQTQMTQEAEEDAQLPEQAPVSSSTKSTDIKTELDDTVIMEEDFSDL